MSPGRSARLIAASGASGLTVALPVRSNVRAVGSVNSRRIDSSGCVRGGTGRIASRLITITTGWSLDAAPSADEQIARHLHDLGTRTSRVACASRSRISAKPTGSS